MNPELLHNGFIVLKNIFTEDQISYMRKIAISYFKSGGGFSNSGGFAKPDWIKDPDLKILLDECNLKNLEKIVSESVGEEVFFIEHNDLHMNRSVGWHKDRLNGKARSFEKNDPWSSVNGETMKIFKLNIYLQDHSDGKGGLVVKRGSHKTRQINVGKEFPIKTNIGDVILFDQRITHKATKSNDKDRLLICFGLGVKNIFFDEFRAGTVFRQSNQSKTR